ncbi:MAG: membrane integrity-associated transporter subunit PqiC [Methylococcales bacterium]|nr:MAG: membrane integrity-associated transporter subunit PqiC [Methylococcales bacterium]
MRGKTKYLLVALMLVLFLSACMRSNKSVQFYRLNASAAMVDIIQEPELTNQALIGLGSIRIPDYLNRPQMVIAISDNQYQLSEEHRWAERLDENISLVLTKLLSSQLGSNRILRYPWSLRQAVDYQVSIDIIEFHIDALGQSRLIAQWLIKRKDQSIFSRRFNYQVYASTTDYEIMVSAQSACLTKLGQDIAVTLKQLIKEEAGN